MSSDVVGHRIFGEGVVIERRWDDAQARVRFRSGLTLWLPVKWLKPLTVAELELDRISAKRILEAFRLGIVPHQDVEYFTFGRGYEIDEFEQALQALKAGSGGVALIEGAYGAGKSHLLEYVWRRAIKIGLAAAVCTLNIQETPPYRPKKVYRDLVYSLRFLRDGAELSFRDLLRQAAADGPAINDHCFLTPVLRRVAEIEDHDPQSEVFWQWIEGESTKEYALDPSSPYRVRGGHDIPALYDFSTAADFYNYLITGISCLAHQQGLGGLVVIIDEFETLSHIWASEPHRRAAHFLEGLIRSAQRDPELKTIDQMLIHNQVRPTPYCYHDSRLLVILATTLSDASPILAQADRRLVLRPFNRPELELIFDQLIKTYETAYPGWQLDAVSREKILTAALNRHQNNIRGFIKYGVEGMDRQRLHVNRSQV